MKTAFSNPEATHKLRELISAECGQVMKIKLVKNAAGGNAEDKKGKAKSEGISDLGIPINEIDE